MAPFNIQLDSQKIGCFIKNCRTLYIHISVDTYMLMCTFFICVCTHILILKDGGSHYAANVGRIPTRVTTWESKVYETIVGICVQNVISLCDHIVYFSTFGHI